MDAARLAPLLAALRALAENPERAWARLRFDEHRAATFTLLDDYAHWWENLATTGTLAPLPLSLQRRLVRLHRRCERTARLRDAHTHRRFFRHRRWRALRAEAATALSLLEARETASRPAGPA